MMYIGSTQKGVDILGARVYTIVRDKERAQTVPRVKQKGSTKMKATRINMEQHTVSVKMDRYELAEVMTALAYLSWYYRYKQLDNLANKAWKMREDVDRAFYKLYSDVD